MLVIFDLDQTLVDSSVCEPLRRSRNWPEVYKRIPSITQYDGIAALIDELMEAGVEIAIVTTSPRPYCEKVIKHVGWPLKATVCYHDTSNHKPHSDPYLAAMTKLKADAADTIAVGDAVKDIEAAEAAGIEAVAALWGSDDAGALRESGASVVCESVEELREALLEFKGRRENG